ncbi:unnamed protein product, partial [Symbiodinium microadriaticum]
ALKSAAQQERLQRQAIRAAGRQEAIAFEIDLSGDDFDNEAPAGLVDIPTKAPSVSGDDQFSRNAKNPDSKSNKSHPGSDKGIKRDGDDCIDQKVSRRQPVATASNRRGTNQASGGRARKEWGAPVDPFKPQIVATRARGESSDATEVEEEEALLARMPSANDM